MNSPHLVPLLLGEAYVPGQGLIAGGWEYVWASWGITWAAIAVYAASLWARRRSSDRSKEPS